MKKLFLATFPQSRFFTKFQLTLRDEIVACWQEDYFETFCALFQRLQRKRFQ